MISVCIATYNGESFIYEQINSILNQLKTTDEIIISDAGSSDSTVEIIESFNDSRIKIYKYSHTAELIKNTVFQKVELIKSNFENALKYASGDYIFMSDQDDVWHDQKVKVLMNELTCNLLVLHDCSIIDRNGKIIKNSLFSESYPSQTLLGVIRRSPFMGCCMAFKRELLNASLPFPPKYIEYDTWIGLCAMRNSTFKIIHEPLINYRRHESNASTCSTKSTNSLTVKITRRFYLVLYYFFY